MLGSKGGEKMILALFMNLGWGNAIKDSSWNMELLATWTDGDTDMVWDVASYQNYIYLAHHNKGVTILAMYDSLGKTVIRQEGRVDSGGIRSFVAVRDTFLYCGYNDMLKIWSIADPANPVFVGMDSTWNYWHPDRTLFYEDYLFVGDDAVFIYNISDPRNPYLVNKPAIPGNGGGMALQDTPYCSFPALFVGYNIPSRDETWIASYDITDPENPVLVDSLLLGDYGHVNSMAAYQNYIYMSVYGGLIVLFDVSDPSNIQLVGADNAPEYDDMLIRQASRRFYLSSADRVETRDLTDPTAPARIGLYRADTAWYFGAIAWQGGRLMVTAANWWYAPWTNDLYIFHYLGDTLSPLPPLPSVQEGAQALSFEARISGNSLKLVVPRRDLVSLRLFDISGRLIREIYSGHLSRGSYTFPLNIEKEPPGIYLLQVIWDGQRTVLKTITHRRR